MPSLRIAAHFLAQQELRPPRPLHLKVNASSPKYHSVLAFHGRLIEALYPLRGTALGVDVSVGKLEAGT